MPTSVFSPDVQAAFDAAAVPRVVAVSVGGVPKDITVPFASPSDWRDTWIYFPMIDRFNNPAAPPASTTLNPPVPFDVPFGAFQGGTFEGLRQQLGYIRDLGAGAIWLSPVFKNCQY